jgi:hypothetical protein
MFVMWWWQLNCLYNTVVVCSCVVCEKFDGDAQISRIKKKHFSSQILLRLTFSDSVQSHD